MSEPRELNPFQMDYQADGKDFRPVPRDVNEPDADPKDSPAVVSVNSSDVQEEGTPAIPAHPSQQESPEVPASVEKVNTPTVPSTPEPLKPPSL